MALIDYFLRVFREKPGKHAQLIRNGNLVVGNNSDIDNLEIYIQDPLPGTLNIRIGDNCLLNGRLILHSSTALIEIGNSVFLGHSTELVCRERIRIGDFVLLSWGITVIDTDAHSLRSAERANDLVSWKKGPAFKDWKQVKSLPVNIANNSWVGFNAIILKGVSVGEGAVIGAGSVVANDVEAYEVAAGNPARMIKKTD
jgi:acetyltransferase-like isoleucine patch superfamily enzyme